MTHRFTRIRIAAALVCGALATAGCGDTTATVPAQVEGAPDELKFTWDASELGGTSLELRGSTVVVRRLRYGQNPRRDSTMVVPTSAAWTRFLDAATDAGVSEWRSGYLAEGIADGSQWDLRIAVDGRVLESGAPTRIPTATARSTRCSPRPSSSRSSPPWRGSRASAFPERAGDGRRPRGDGRRGAAVFAGRRHGFGTRGVLRDHAHPGHR